MFSDSLAACELVCVLLNGYPRQALVFRNQNAAVHAARADWDGAWCLQGVHSPLAARLGTGRP